METTSSEIAKRLEALNKWHEEYRILLQSKHEKQRALFNAQNDAEKHNSFIAREFNTADSHSNVNEEENYKSSTVEIASKLKINLDAAPELSKQTSGYSTDSKNDHSLTDIKELPKERNDCERKLTRFPQRKFLRKGEGLKQRFKIEPDAFNLNKLPPYKYAKAHPKLRIKTKKSKSKPSTTQQKKIDEKQNNNDDPGISSLSLDAQEKRFQQLLFASKSMVNSTPDRKSSTVDTRLSTYNSYEKHLKNDHPVSLIQQQSSFHSMVSTNSTDSFALDMMWSKVLDPLKIKPVTVSKIRQQQHVDQGRPQSIELNESQDEHLNLFELLEKKAKEGSFSTDCSLVKRVLSKQEKNNDDDEQESDIIPITVEIRNAHIEPNIRIEEIDHSKSNSESEVEDDNEDYRDQEQQAANVSETESIECNDHPTSRIRVHFAKQDDGDVTLKNEMETSGTILHNKDNLKEMNSDLIFEQVKSLVFAALSKNEKSLSEASFLNDSILDSKKIKELAEQNRERVAELEKQIALFRETNMQLLRSKQEHEMEKESFMLEQEEALEKIHDEKMKVEIQLHDERMKLEEDRRKIEEKLRMQKTSIVSNERKEIAKLKEEIESLKSKLRDKEQTHIAAQGRLRSQLRCLEKEQKVLYAEIERLSKENKKLEKIIAQFSRERNMNMLQEINKNIVKLSESQNKSASSCENVSTSKASNQSNFKSVASSKSVLLNAKKSDELAKTIKITASSFTKLLGKENNHVKNMQLKKISFDKDGYDDIEFRTVTQDDDIEPANISLENDDENTESTNISHNDTDEDIELKKRLNKKEQLDMNLAREMKNSPSEENESAKLVKPNFKVLTRETITPDGGKEILYPNGTLRKESSDGLTVRMMYFNGDVKETNVNEGTVKYYYAKTNTWHTTYLDGLEIIEFPNGQIEHRHRNGVIEIHFPNSNCVKVTDPNEEKISAEWRFQDGSILLEMRNGDKLLTLSNGQKELHTKEFKRREYPDGTVKTVFPDGSYETRYSNGRIRLKDKDGNLIMDSEMQHNDN